MPTPTILKGPPVTTASSKAQEIITQFLTRANKSTDVTDETSLWADGLALDSLEAAELSVMLEDALGSDPFSAGGEMPDTIGDVKAFYAGVA
jgi:acyl carrier protein